MTPTGIGAVDVDRAFNGGRAHDVQRTLANIHAVARHLLNLDVDSDDLFVGVQPLGAAWRVQVVYASFKLTKKATKLEDVLEETLRELTNQVSRKLDESMRIVALLRDGVSAPGPTYQGIEDALRMVPFVLAVEIKDTNVLGVVDIIVSPSRPQTIEERDEMCVRIGEALQRYKMAGCRCDVKIAGLIVDTEGAPFR